MAVKHDTVLIELIINVIVWTSAVFYSIYCFTIDSNRYFRYYKDEYGDFTSGWFIHRRKDAGDDEWKVMRLLIKNISLWLIFSAAVSEVLRTLKLFKVLQIWQIIISTFFVLTQFGVVPLTVMLVQPLLFSVALIKRQKLIIWLCNILFLLVISIYSKYIFNGEFWFQARVNEQTAHLTLISVCWINLKCVSYCSDFIDEKRMRQEHLEFLSYCLYLPNTICGPFIPYYDFKTCHQNCGNLKKRLFQLIVDVVRFSFWLLFTEFCLHFIYVNATSFHPEWVKTFSSWALYGYGYTMGQFFHLKYLVVYGFATSFAKFDFVKVPSLPVCIGRIHLYSDMWKYFDVGFYRFLSRYIYIPLMKNGLVRNRLLSSLICFVFAFVWHGCHHFIMVWSLLNHIGIVIEHFGKLINQMYLENSRFSIKLGPTWLRRLKCIAASPLLALSAVSNFYFFGGTEIGNVFVHRILNDNIQSTLLLLIMLYSCCQVSTEVKTQCNKKPNK